MNLLAFELEKIDRLSHTMGNLASVPDVDGPLSTMVVNSAMLPSGVAVEGLIGHTADIVYRGIMRSIDALIKVVHALSKRLIEVFNTVRNLIKSFYSRKINKDRYKYAEELEKSIDPVMVDGKIIRRIDYVEYYQLYQHLLSPRSHVITPTTIETMMDLWIEIIKLLPMDKHISQLIRLVGDMDIYTSVNTVSDTYRQMEEQLVRWLREIESIHKRYLPVDRIKRPVNGYLVGIQKSHAYYVVEKRDREYRRFLSESVLVADLKVYDGMELPSLRTYKHMVAMLDEYTRLVVNPSKLDKEEKRLTKLLDTIEKQMMKLRYRLSEDSSTTNATREWIVLLSAMNNHVSTILRLIMNLRTVSVRNHLVLDHTLSRMLKYYKSIGK